MLGRISCLSAVHEHVGDQSSCNTAPLSRRCESQTSDRTAEHPRCLPEHGWCERKCRIAICTVEPLNIGRKLVFLIERY